MQVIDDGDELPAPVAGATEGTAQPFVATGASATESGSDDVAITLSLDDLLPDANGEVVIMSVGGGSSLSIVTDEQICDAGVADSHITADGFDVGGLAFCAFESGTKLYYSQDLNLTIAQTDAY